MKIHFNTPIGKILIEGSAGGIRKLVFMEAEGKSALNKISENQKSDENDENKDETGMSSLISRQLEEYFSGHRRSFNLPLDLQGTDFQKKVWNELLNIPFGKTISYKELAIRLGDVKAIRAAGTANGANPVSIIVPCHRVIGSDGSLVGYGGGLWRKRWLLQHENPNIQIPNPKQISNFNHQKNKRQMDLFDP